ncbi:MAG: Rieske 2Fe-2S domain-containing protein [Xanthobacteraceae bacterium]
MTLVEKPARERPSPRAAQSVDIATTKRGTPGGKFMRQFWLAIEASADLPAGRAKPIRIMGENYTLYRGQSGRAQVIDERCPHRGAQMHLGWVEDDDIRCVYHGWKFSCDGQCIEQPAEKENFNRKVAIKTYPTREHMGQIFAYFGEGDPPSWPPFPEPAADGIIDVWPTYKVPCNYLQCFENSMDEVHVAFTHAPGGSHAKLAVDLPVITAEEKDWGILRFGTRANGKVRHTLHYAPNIVRVIVPPLAGLDGVGGWPEIIFSFTPVDDENCLWLITSKVFATGKDADVFREKRAELDRKRAEAPPVMDVVHDLWSGKLHYADVRHPDLAIVQDIAVQAGQGPIENRDDEYLGRSDAAIIVWRRILEREMRLIAEGKPGKQWKTPPADVVPQIGF